MHSELELISKAAQQLVTDGFDIDAFLLEQAIKHDNWLEHQKQELGEEKFEWQTDYFGGSCRTCGRQLDILCILKLEYLVCYACRKHQLWAIDQWTSSSHEQQAIRTLVIDNTEEV